MSGFKKPILILFSAIAILVVLVVLFFSPILKYLIEKYDETYTGRRITVDWVYANPFTGYIHLKNFKIHELASDSIFFSAKGLSINFAMSKMLRKTYEISEITLNHPKGYLIQIGKDFNLDDLITKFSSEKSQPEESEKIHFNILDINIIEGEFFLIERKIPINYSIKKVYIESKGIQWNTDTLSASFSFQSGIGSGVVSGNFSMNTKNQDYRLTGNIQKFDLNIVEQYLREFSNYGVFSAFLDANIKASGNLTNAEKINLKGSIVFNDFHYGKNKNEDYASFDKFTLGITDLSPYQHKYIFDSLFLEKPYFKYERYDSSDNLETMFGKNGSNISKISGDPEHFNLVLEIARYVKSLARNFLQSYYKINHLAVNKGMITFNDFSLSEKFSIELNPFSIVADSIDKDHEKVDISVTSGIKPFGNASVSISINPRDSIDFDMVYDFNKIPASSFNPYTIAYTSFPLDRGTLQFKGVWNVRNGIIKSDNHLVILDPRVTKRIRNKDLRWIPLPLIMSFVRDRGNVIDYEIPISGNLKNPKFHLKDIIGDIFENIFVKPATTPYRMQVKNAETEIEKSLTIKWEMNKSSLLSKQEAFLEKITDFLVKNPDASIVISPQLYRNKEKEYILLFQAKKEYYSSLHSINDKSLSEEDYEEVDKMSIKDPLFVKYINDRVPDSLIFSIQEKCSRIISTETVANQLKALNQERENNFLECFHKSGIEKQISILKSTNIIPYNGFSFYKITYKGEFPEQLVKAHQEMNEFDDEAPRKKFKQDRKKNKKCSLEKRNYFFAKRIKYESYNIFDK